MMLESRSRATYILPSLPICIVEAALLLQVSSDPETSQTIISGMGELHLEIYVERMNREYKVRCACCQVTHGAEARVPCSCAAQYCPILRDWSGIQAWF